MAATIPPGVDIYADIRGTIIGPVITLMCLCTASVILRVIAKRAAHANLELDDYLIFAALVCDAFRSLTYIYIYIVLKFSQCFSLLNIAPYWYFRPLRYH